MRGLRGADNFEEVGVGVVVLRVGERESRQPVEPEL